jgi:two-component system OmpR family sensor kinase
MSESAHKEFAILCEGIARAQRLVDQLLALARAQDAPQAPSLVLLEETLRAVLEDLLPLAHARRIDLGIVEMHGQDVAGPENELRTLLKNIIENALRYTPEGGCVDVSLLTDANGKTCLIVEDDGPGIPSRERERVFDPFYRIVGNDDVGSGLGLSIVRAVCDKIGAQVTLMDAQKGHGLRVEVRFQEPRA